ncbi:hypothetical protein SODALDRAFT_70210 [Sodiomyces alkalinus F11]|uniref:Uncharacterized protein n=1 Tax=Sodiomyces alkalinus (strain CBS 110278 / VKM F-3762 / F11) TaxID=1314773 RepID=A0A3N2PM38_SODAK|nr:hypothetical protein SODALDRAFT_70210 [Sodiomyces alkalinus F11]ROT35583.1 hypothetical protein SODALDRAFT_70210 [Sodiomyces alkalinus F11]
MLDLLDPDLRRYLLSQRNNLSEGGTTPVHYWGLRQQPGQPSFVPYGLGRYLPTISAEDTQEKKLAVLKLLLGYSGGAELGMLNGAGETLLHSAVMGSDVDMVEGLLRFNPELLYRENAVGRTPAEVARGQLMAFTFKQPDDIIVRRGRWEQGASGLLNVDPAEFLEATKQGRTVPPLTADGGEQEAQKRRRVWDVVAGYMARYPGQRRLVSLGEANDVAKRLSEKFGFGSNHVHGAKAQEEDDGENEGEDKQDKEDRMDALNFVTRVRSSKILEAWRP